MLSAIFCAALAASSHAHAAPLTGPGSVVWDAAYAGEPMGAATQARGVAVAPDGGVYVAGHIEPPDGNHDFLIVKYSPDGQLVWARRYDYSWYDVGTAASSDIVGDAVVAGASQNLRSPSDAYISAYYTEYAVLKYAPDGELLFEMSASGAGKNCVPAGVVVDSDGGIYVTGSARIATDAYTAFYTVKFDPAGILLWERLDDWNTEAAATAVALDPDENPVVTGWYYDGEAENYDVRTVKYSPDGQRVLMDLTYKDPARFDDEKAHGVHVDADGDIYITGETSLGGSALTLRYDPQGKLAWAETYDGAGGRTTGLAVTSDRYGRAYAVGRVERRDQEAEMLLLVYAPEGTLVAELLYPSGGYSTAHDAALLPGGDLLVAGATTLREGPSTARAARIAGWPAPSGASLTPREVFSPRVRIALRGADMQALGRLMLRVGGAGSGAGGVVELDIP